jgi:murein DD-endopeptidase MepM/ murein hydrolase activator NlpD
LSPPSQDGRHRASKKATRKPRRLRVGLALPAAAASVALAFTSSQAIAFSPNTKVTAPQTASVDLDHRDRLIQTATDRDRQIQLAKDKALAKVRADATVTASRSAARKAVAVRALAADRALKAKRALEASHALELKLAAQAHGWQLPIKTYVRTSGFGWRWGRLHAGEDFAAPTGTNLASMSTGTVDFAGEQSGYGNLIKIRYWDGTVTYYAHMSGISVTEGEGVKPGQVVGQSGNSGHSTGPHLHLEIHPGNGEAVEPLPWMAAHQIAV